ncbi:MAG TPA: TetR/AcrR family transcriptional regulator [Burkholderiaceae bacterium]|nr:TetR/AcrR family transcriptional regulator [Burkholderiaceae bacterium]
MKLAERRQRFVDVAEQLFLQRGYSGVSVNEVVRLAGGSLATLYAEFGTKEELFEAVMSRRIASFFDPLSSAEADAADDVRAGLQLLAARIQERMLSPDSLAMYRLAVSEGPRFPALRRAVLSNGLDSALQRLGEHFAQLAQRHRLRIDDPRLAAERFVALVQGQHQFIAACGSASSLSREQRASQIEQAVSAFLSIYRSAPAAE